MADQRLADASSLGAERCFSDGCRKSVSADDFCHGCRHYVCEEHAVNLGLFGSHEPDDHLEWNDG